MGPGLLGLAGAGDEPGIGIDEMNVEDHAGDSAQVAGAKGAAFVEGFEHPGRAADPSAGAHRQHLAVFLEHVDGADAGDLAARHRRDSGPVHPAVMADIKRLPVGHPGEIAGADIAEKAGLVIDEFQRPHIAALLGPDHGPGLAAVVGAIDPAGSVAVPAGQGVGEGDRVLFVVQRVGHGRQFYPVLVGAGRGRDRPREADGENRLAMPARRHGTILVLAYRLRGSPMLPVTVSVSQEALPGWAAWHL